MEEKNDLEYYKLELEKQVEEKKVLEAKILSYRENYLKDYYTQGAKVSLQWAFDNKNEEAIEFYLKEIENNYHLKKFDEYFGIISNRVGEI